MDNQVKKLGSYDHGDEGTLTHYLGNDDYVKGSNEPSPDELEHPKLDGYEASGNEVTEEDLKEIEREKKVETEKKGARR